MTATPRAKTPRKELLFSFSVQGRVWDVYSFRFNKRLEGDIMGCCDEQSSDILLNYKLFKPTKSNGILLRQTWLHELTHLATASVFDSLRQNENGHLEISSTNLDELVAEAVARAFTEVMAQIPPQFLTTLLGISNGQQ